jgi:hypothetical protein
MNINVQSIIPCWRSVNSESTQPAYSVDVTTHKITGLSSQHCNIIVRNITQSRYYTAYNKSPAAWIAQSVQWLDYRMDDLEVLFPTAVVGDLSLRHRVHTGSGAHTASYPMDTGASTEVKRTGREADHSPPCNADIIKNAQELNLHSPACLYGVMFN